MDDNVRLLARGAGILVDWVDAAGRPRAVSIETLRRVLDALGMLSASRNDIAESRERIRKQSSGAGAFCTAVIGTPVKIGDASLAPINEPGYHTRECSGREITVAVAPPRCLTFSDFAPSTHMYGLAVQLYSLRGGRSGGFGDVAALTEFVAKAAANGADAVALSPTHSGFAADSAYFAPYSPSSRIAINPLYADPAILFGPDWAETGEGANVPQGSLIDWTGAAPQRYSNLRTLYERFTDRELSVPGSKLGADFRAFETEGGPRLREHAIFEALHAHWLAAQNWDWRDWPDGWRGPAEIEIIDFAARERDAVQFHIFLQWVADRSFRHAHLNAREAGMRIGLISDLAVGMNPAGSHAWSRPSELLVGLSIGAPPDLFNARGQNWGLTSFSPQALIENGYEAFIATLRAAMRHAGGVRIDHAMGLSRLWVIPEGAPADEGAYLTYPVEDMLRLIALESFRNRTLVIGEDLGTVEPVFRESMAGAGIAGMDVLWFMRDEQSFFPPSSWRSGAVAMTSTHDLPTVAGWWTGHDIKVRNAVGLADFDRETKERARDRHLLSRAIREAEADTGDMECRVLDGAVSFTAASPAPLALIPLEDVIGIVEQPNLPGTFSEHPNWRRRLPLTTEQIFETPAVRGRLERLRTR